LRKGFILVNGKPAEAQTRVAKGSKISVPRLTTSKITKKSIKIDTPQPPVQQPSLKLKQKLPSPVQQPSPAKPPPPIQPPPPVQEPPVVQQPPEIQQSPPVQPEQPKEKKRGSPLYVRFFHPPEILWQDSGLIAFNKPAGLAVHGHTSLDRMVKAYLINKLPPSLSFKPGPLHRLDKPSSGIVVFSTSLEGANIFSNLMKEKKIKKTYMAIVEGALDSKHFWTDFLVRNKEEKKSYIIKDEEKEIKDKKGKIAITMAMPLAVAKIKDKLFTLVEAEIETGRTHQIRAQSSFHGHPLAGDKKYGGGSFRGGFYLHSCRMEFTIDNVKHKIECPLPLEFQKLVDTMFATNPV
jgi:23S rRNA pseudouridine955/2504/2580 synthase